MKENVSKVISSILLLCFCLLPPGLSLEARELFVSKTGTGESGLTWETAFYRIGDALMAATTGDNIYCEQGLYEENVTIDTPLSLVGGVILDATKDIIGIDKTIVKGVQEGVAIRVTRSCYIGRFTMTGGFGIGGRGVRVIGSATSDINVVFEECVIEGNQTYSLGGGALCSGCTVTLRDCIVEDNVAQYTGAGIQVIDATASLEHCIIRNNKLPQWLPGYEGEIETQGGGIHSEKSCVTMENCLVYGNEAGLASQIGLSVEENLGCRARLMNCTVVADDEKPVFVSQGEVSNTIIRSKGAPFAGTAEPRVVNSNISGGSAGAGNIDSTCCGKAEIARFRKLNI